MDTYQRPQKIRKKVFSLYCLFVVIACLMVIAVLITVVIYTEQNLNKDILNLRINITIIMKNIENNCSKLPRSNSTVRLRLLHDYFPGESLP